MPAAAVAAGAATFLWLGMVLAISFLEAPLKFRAPGVTLQVGLGIGRLVFRALNACELVLATVIALSMITGRPGLLVAVTLLSAIVILLLQLALLRPRLTRRSDAVLAGQETARSRAHLAYVVLEMIKVVVLVVGGISVLTQGMEG